MPASPIACTCSWNPASSNAAARPPQLGLVPHRHAVRVRVVGVRLEQRRRAALDDAVREELHRARPHPPAALRVHPGAGVHELRHLLPPAQRVGPQREARAHGSSPRAVTAEVRLQRRRCRGPPRVLHPGDPRGGEPLGAAAQPRLDLRPPRARRRVEHEVAGLPLAHRAERRAVVAPLDPPDGGVGRGGADPGPAQRLAVAPHRVVVGRPEHDRAVGHRVVQPARVEAAAGASAGSYDPPTIQSAAGLASAQTRTASATAPHARADAHRGPGLLEAALHRVRVPVPERRQREPPARSTTSRARRRSARASSPRASTRRPRRASPPSTMVSPRPHAPAGEEGRRVHEGDLSRPRAVGLSTPLAWVDPVACGEVFFKSRYGVDEVGQPREGPALVPAGPQDVGQRSAARPTAG